jgi:hypothetical protein
MTGRQVPRQSRLLKDKAGVVRDLRARGGDLNTAIADAMDTNL